MSSLLSSSRTERHRAGGAALTAILATEMTGRQVALVTGIGEDQHAGHLLDLLRRHVEVHCLSLFGGGTPTEFRIHRHSQPVARLEVGEGQVKHGPVPEWTRRALLGASAILVADYGRGTTAHPALAEILAELKPALDPAANVHGYLAATTRPDGRTRSRSSSARLAAPHSAMAIRSSLASMSMACFTPASPAAASPYK